MKIYTHVDVLPHVVVHVYRHHKSLSTCCDKIRKYMKL